MTGIVHVFPSGQQFPVEGRDSILDAALHTGLSLDYGCSNGNCGRCRARLISGKVEQTTHFDYRFSEADKNNGSLLLCAFTAVGEVEIEVAEGSAIQQQHISAKVKRLAPLSDGVLLLHLQTPRTQRLRFLAGQNATLDLGNDISSEYPIASCPCDDRNIQFHIRSEPEDEFAQRLMTRKSGDPVELTGPFGDFTLIGTGDRPIVFLAYNTGFAPLKSLIEHAMQLELRQELRLYWLADREAGQYMHNLVRSWTDAFDSFFYVPLSLKLGATAELDDQGAEHRARLSELIEREIFDRVDLSNHDLYVAGPQPVPELAASLLRRLGEQYGEFKCAIVK